MKSSFTSNRYFITALLVFFQALANAQIPSPLAEKVIPPSPNAASLGKYGNNPVSLNSGTPSISIPLYQIKGKDLQLAISLNYHASGLKVDEVASWVGLGWSLSSGGVITRSVKGLPDEATDGYFNRFALWQQIKDQPYNEDLYDPNYQFRARAAEGDYDLMADAFFFNFSGYSGRIVINALTRKAVCIPYQDFKIELPAQLSGSGTSLEWIITTPNGTRYIFNNQDSESSRMNGIAYLSAWYLSRIENANRTEAINFRYAAATRTGTQEVSGITSTALDPLHHLKECNYPVLSGRLTETLTIHPKFLEAITYKNLTIDFSATENREDINGVNPPGQKLNSVRVSRYESNPNRSQVLHVFDFEYGYFDSNEPGQNVPEQKRLRLDLVKEVGKAPYTFLYNPLPMPHYQSYSKDHWGYFNAAGFGNGPGTTSMIPPVSPLYATGYRNNSFTIANRNTNPESVKACILEKITYPTGGSTEFQYENHLVTRNEQVDNYPVGVTLRAKAYGNDALHSAGNSLDTRKFEIAVQGSVESDADGGLPNVRATKSFTIAGQIVLFTHRKTIPGGGAPMSYFETRLYKQPVNLQEYTVIPNDQSEVRLSLPEGTYMMAVLVTHDGYALETQISYTDYVDDYPLRERRIIGGLRIARIIDSDGRAGQPSVTTEYKYLKNSLNPNPDFEESSGKLFFEPDYDTESGCGQLIMSAYDTDDFGRVQGNHIGYDEVLVRKTGGENGFVIYKYNNSANEITRQDLREEVYYDQNKVKVKEVINYYSYEDGSLGFYFQSLAPVTKISIDKVIKAPPKEDEGEPLPLPPMIYRYTIQNYSYGTAWAHLKWTKERIYNHNDGTAFIENYTEYQHEKAFAEVAEAAKHTQPTKLIQIASDGSRLVTEFHYPFDYNDSNPAIASLKSRYIKDAVIEKTVKREVEANPKVISGEITTYQLQNGQVLPRETYRLETRVPLAPTEVENVRPVFGIDEKYFKPKLTFDQYDNFGNVLQYRNPESLCFSFLWGYVQTHPVAHAVNARWNQIAYSGFESDQDQDKGNWNYTTLSVTGEAQAGDRFFRGDITARNTLPPGNYILTFWAKGDGSVAVNNANVTVNTQGWKHFEVRLSNPGAVSIQTGQIAIDELRLHPDDARMTTYTYNQFAGISSQTGPDGVTVYYHYDNQQRLSYIRDQDGNIIKRYQYHYIGQPEN